MDVVIHADGTHSTVNGAHGIFIEQLCFCSSFEPLSFPTANASDLQDPPQIWVFPRIILETHVIGFPTVSHLNVKGTLRSSRINEFLLIYYLKGLLGKGNPFITIRTQQLQYLLGVCAKCKSQPHPRPIELQSAF